MAKNRLDINLNLNTTQADQQRDAYTARQKKSINEVLAAEKAAAKEAADASKREAKNATDQRKRELKDLQEAIKARYKEEEAAANATAKEVAAAEKKKAAQIQASVAKQVKAQEQSNESAKATIKTMAGFGAAALGLSSVSAVVGIFVEHFDSIRRDAFEAAKSVSSMRDTIRELQALRGQMGNTGEGIGHLFGVSAQTLQTTNDVQEMEKSALGVGELAIGPGKNMTRAEFDKAMAIVGKMQTLEGGDAGAYGTLLGQIALQSKGPMTGEQAGAQANRLFQIQQPGGFHTFSQGINQYAKLNPYVKNGILTPEEAMTLLSSASVSSPDEAATRVDQMVRSVLAGRLKSRNMKMGEDVEFTKTDEYMKGLGIKEGDTAPQMLDTIAADLKKQQGANAKFNAHDYLLTHGFANQEDRLAIMDYAGSRNKGDLDKIEAAAKAPLDPNAIPNLFNQRVAKDQFMQNRQADIAEQAAQAQQGMKEEPLVAVQKAAHARLVAQGKITGTYEEWRNMGAWGRWNQDFFLGGRNHQVDQEAQRIAMEGARNAGVDFTDPTTKHLAHGDMQAGYIGDEALRKLIDQTQMAGGSPLAGVAADLRASAKALSDAADRLNKGNPPVPAPMPAKPAPVAVRP